MKESTSSCRAIAGAVLIAFVSVACGSSGGAGRAADAAEPAEPVVHEDGDYHCRMELRTTTPPETFRSCYEFRNLPGDEVEEREEACASEAAFSAGTWGVGPCPTEGLTASCTDPIALRAFSSSFRYYAVDGGGYTESTARDHCEEVVQGRFEASP